MALAPAVVAEEPVEPILDAGVEKTPPPFDERNVSCAISTGWIFPSLRALLTSFFRNVRYLFTTAHMLLREKCGPLRCAHLRVC